MSRTEHPTVYLYSVLRSPMAPAVPKGMTLARRHAPYGFSTHRLRRLVHRVDRVAIFWFGERRPPLLGCRWGCGGDSIQPILAAEIPQHLDRCRRCGLTNGAFTDLPHVVYFAQRDGLIKIGHTKNLGVRIDALGAQLLAIEPGGWHREQELHRCFREHRVSSEWFAPNRELLAHIASLDPEQAAS